MPERNVLNRRDLLAVLAATVTARAAEPKAPPTTGHELAPGSVLKPGDKLNSPNGRYTLILQTDGNLVWLDRNRVLWSSGTWDAQATTCRMQADDGNLVIYGVLPRESKSGSLWQSMTKGHPGARLVCQSDGNLVIYQGNQWVWQSDTALEPIAKCAAYVKAKEQWSADHLYEFLNALPRENMLSLKKALGLLDENAGTDQLKGKSQDVPDVQREALWLSTHAFKYPFKAAATHNYHKELVQWVASEAEIDDALIREGSTFAIERRIQLKLFEQLWDKLTVDQRKELLKKIDPHESIKDHAALAAGGGAVAIATLSTTVAFTGFAFYTTMSVAISTAAGFFGLTLPFTVYTTASSVVAFLCGPVGWAIMGLAALGGLALAGRANVKKTTAFVCQIHALKAAALIAAEVPEPDVF